MFNRAVQQVVEHLFGVKGVFHRVVEYAAIYDLYSTPDALRQRLNTVKQGMGRADKAQIQRAESGMSLLSEHPRGRRVGTVVHLHWPHVKDARD
jgi:hypothetical protein